MLRFMEIKTNDPKLPKNRNPNKWEFQMVEWKDKNCHDDGQSVWMECQESRKTLKTYSNFENGKSET